MIESVDEIYRKFREKFAFECAYCQDVANQFIPRFKGMEDWFEKDEEKFALDCHGMLSGGIGMKIRNELKLWEPETELRIHMQNLHQLEHPDDMSHYLLCLIHRKGKQK